ncbi:MAG: glycosyltransferase family 2 protein [Bacteroidetes bacterium]|nr:glycosyltransferase family 2 protein [Bacteroidota bacterium]
MQQDHTITKSIDISIIIPMYNAEQYISRAIASVINQQTHALIYEIIIIDDVSTDASCKVVKALNNPHIKLIELTHNGGTANARNQGLKIATGRWIQFLDSDDFICNDLYAKFEKKISPGYNCYLFSVIYEYSNYNLKQTITYIDDKRAFGHYGSVCNKFIKREVCLLFKQEFSFEDVCFIFDMMMETELKIALIDDAFYYYNCKNTSSKMANFNAEEFEKMYAYVYSRIDRADALSKMFFLEIFVAILFDKQRPFFMSLRIAIKTVIKLWRYLPAVIRNQNRKFIISERFSPE